MQKVVKVLYIIKRGRDFIIVFEVIKISYSLIFTDSKEASVSQAVYMTKWLPVQEEST